MKDNRKNRKLNFIKNKNKLRLGYTKFYCIEKTSKEMVLDELYWKRLIKTANESLYKNYKLKLQKIIIESTDNEHDCFLKNLQANKITLSLK